MQSTPLPEARRVPASAGRRWIVAAWRLFRDYPLPWIGIGVVFMLIQLVLSMVPLLGQLLAAILTPALMAGGAVAAARAARDERPRVLDLFGCFESQRALPFFVLGAMYLAASVLVYLVFFSMAAMLGFSMPTGTLAPEDPALLGEVVSALLVAALPATFLLTMAFWLAPILVLWHGLAPLAALRESFTASVRNFGAFFVMFLWMMALMMLAAMLLGLGMLVFTPLALLVPVVGYHDLFGSGRETGQNVDVIG